MRGKTRSNAKLSLSEEVGWKTGSRGVGVENGE